LRVLLDEQLPRQLAKELVGHEVSTVQAEGWSGLLNGDLLSRASERGFEVFVTKDQNIEYQQTLEKSRLGTIVLAAPRHSLEVLRPLVPETLEAIRMVTAGEVRRVPERTSPPKTAD